VLRILEQATQTQAHERYQTVQDFWDELAEATLPPTRPLAVTQEGRKTPSFDLNLDVAVAEAPPRPRFETSRELQREQASGNGMLRPRIVVPVAGAANQFESPMIGAPGRVTVEVPRYDRPPVQVAGPTPQVQPRRRGRAFLVSVILILTFAGLLLATGAYVRSRLNQQQQQQQGGQIAVGREGVTTTDLNLRGDPSTFYDPVGLAESGSRVRVLNISNNWCEVQVLQHARAKEDPGSADRGWVNKKFLRFD